jgi:RNA polymerase sigma-70 factor, ECF subfamily
MSDNKIQQPRYDEFVGLFSANARRIYATIYSMIPSWADADDVFQETSRVLWQKFDDFQFGTDFFAWARQIARFQTLNFRQRQQRSKVKFTDAFLDAVASATDADADQLEEEQRALADCMKKLKSRERNMIVLRFAPDATTKTVAERLDMSVDAVYKAVSRIRTTLLKCIEQTLKSHHEEEQ